MSATETEEEAHVRRQAHVWEVRDRLAREAADAEPEAVAVREEVARREAKRAADAKADEEAKALLESGKNFMLVGHVGWLEWNTMGALTRAALVNAARANRREFAREVAQALLELGKVQP